MKIRIKMTQEVLACLMVIHKKDGRTLYLTPHTGRFAGRASVVNEREIVHTSYVSPDYRLDHHHMGKYYWYTEGSVELIGFETNAEAATLLNDKY